MMQANVYPVVLCVTALMTAWTGQMSHHPVVSCVSVFTLDSCFLLLENRYALGSSYLMVNIIYIICNNSNNCLTFSLLA